MTLFDSIRYPVHERSTDEELTRIPLEIRLKWMTMYDGEHHMHTVPLERLVRDLRHTILTWNETPRERWERWCNEVRTEYKKIFG